MKSPIGRNTSFDRYHCVEEEEECSNDSAWNEIPRVVRDIMEASDTSTAGARERSIVSITLLPSTVQCEYYEKNLRCIKQELNAWETGNIQDNKYRQPWFILPCGLVGMDLVVVRSSSGYASSIKSAIQPSSPIHQMHIIMNPLDIMKMSYSDDNSNEWESVRENSSVQFSSIENSPASASHYFHDKCSNGAVSFTESSDDFSSSHEDSTIASEISQRSSSMIDGIRIFVASVQVASPASKAGFKEGDEVIEWMFDGLTSTQKFYSAIMTNALIWVKVMRMESHVEKAIRLQEELFPKRINSSNEEEVAFVFTPATKRKWNECDITVNKIRLRCGIENNCNHDESEISVAQSNYPCTRTFGHCIGAGAHQQRILCCSDNVHPSTFSLGEVDPGVSWKRVQNEIAATIENNVDPSLFMLGEDNKTVLSWTDVHEEIEDMCTRRPGESITDVVKREVHMFLNDNVQGRDGSFFCVDFGPLTEIPWEISAGKDKRTQVTAMGNLLQVSYKIMEVTTTVQENGNVFQIDLQRLVNRPWPDAIWKGLSKLANVGKFALGTESLLEVMTNVDAPISKWEQYYSVSCQNIDILKKNNGQVDESRNYIEASVFKTPPKTTRTCKSDKSEEKKAGSPTGVADFVAQYAATPSLSILDPNRPHYETRICDSRKCVAIGRSRNCRIRASQFPIKIGKPAEIQRRCIQDITSTLSPGFASAISGVKDRLRIKRYRQDLRAKTHCARIEYDPIIISRHESSFRSRYDYASDRYQGAGDGDQNSSTFSDSDGLRSITDAGVHSCAEGWNYAKGRNVANTSIMDEGEDDNSSIFSGIADVGSFHEDVYYGEGISSSASKKLVFRDKYFVEGEDEAPADLSIILNLSAWKSSTQQAPECPCERMENSDSVNSRSVIVSNEDNGSKKQQVTMNDFFSISTTILQSIPEEEPEDVQENTSNVELQHKIVSEDFILHDLACQEAIINATIYGISKSSPQAGAFGETALSVTSAGATLRYANDDRDNKSDESAVASNGDAIQNEIDKTDDHLYIPPCSQDLAQKIGETVSNRAMSLTSKCAAGKDCLTTLDNAADIQDNMSTCNADVSSGDIIENGADPPENSEELKIDHAKFTGRDKPVSLLSKSKSRSLSRPFSTANSRDGGKWSFTPTLFGLYTICAEEDKRSDLTTQIEVKNYQTEVAGHKLILEKQSSQQSFDERSNQDGRNFQFFSGCQETSSKSELMKDVNVSIEVNATRTPSDACSDIHDLNVSAQYEVESNDCDHHFSVPRPRDSSFFESKGSQAHASLAANRYLVALQGSTNAGKISPKLFHRKKLACLENAATIKSTPVKTMNSENVDRDTREVPDEVSATQLNRAEDCGPTAKHTDCHAVYEKTGSIGDDKGAKEQRDLENPPKITDRVSAGIAPLTEDQVDSEEGFQTLLQKTRSNAFNKVGKMSPARFLRHNVSASQKCANLKIPKGILFKNTEDGGEKALVDICAKDPNATKNEARCFPSFATDMKGDLEVSKKEQYRNNSLDTSKLYSVEARFAIEEIECNARDQAPLQRASSSVVNRYLLAVEETTKVGTTRQNVLRSQKYVAPHRASSTNTEDANNVSKSVSITVVADDGLNKSDVKQFTGEKLFLSDSTSNNKVTDVNPTNCNLPVYRCCQDTSEESENKENASVSIPDAELDIKETSLSSSCIDKELNGSRNSALRMFGPVNRYILAARGAKIDDETCTTNFRRKTTPFNRKAADPQVTRMENEKDSNIEGAEETKDAIVARQAPNEISSNKINDLEVANTMRDPEIEAREIQPEQSSCCQLFSKAGSVEGIKKSKKEQQEYTGARDNISPVDFNNDETDCEMQLHSKPNSSNNDDVEDIKLAEKDQRLRVSTRQNPLYASLIGDEFEFKNSSLNITKKFPAERKQNFIEKIRMNVARTMINDVHFVEEATEVARAAEEGADDITKSASTHLASDKVSPAKLNCAIHAISSEDDEDCTNQGNGLRILESKQTTINSTLVFHLSNQKCSTETAATENHQIGLNANPSELEATISDNRDKTTSNLTEYVIKTEGTHLPTVSCIHQQPPDRQLKESDSSIEEKMLVEGLVINDTIICPADSHICHQKPVLVSAPNFANKAAVNVSIFAAADNIELTNMVTSLSQTEMSMLLRKKTSSLKKQQWSMLSRKNIAAVFGKNDNDQGVSNDLNEAQDLTRAVANDNVTVLSSNGHRIAKQIATSEKEDADTGELLKSFPSTFNNTNANFDGTFTVSSEIISCAGGEGDVHSDTTIRTSNSGKCLINKKFLLSRLEISKNPSSGCQEMVEHMGEENSKGTIDCECDHFDQVVSTEAQEEVHVSLQELVSPEPFSEDRSDSSGLEAYKVSLEMEIMLMRAKLATRSKWIKSRRLVQSLNQRLLDALDRNIKLEAEISSISFDAASFASELEARCDSVCQMNYLSERTMSELTKAQDNLCELEMKFVSISLERDQLLIQMTAAKSEKMCHINEVQCENRNLENVKNSAQSEKVELEAKLESYLFIHEDLISRASELAVQLDAAKTRVSFYERRLELVSKYVKSLEDKATLLETQLEKTLSSNIALEQEVSNRRQICLELEKAVATNEAKAKKPEQDELERLRTKVRELQKTVQRLEMS